MDRMKEMSPDTLMSSFQNQQNNSEVVRVLKELFDIKKIKLITDLTDDEIKLITRIRMVAEIKNVDIYDKGITEYISMQLSKKRRSRTEIIEALKGYTQPRTGLQRIFGMGGNRA